MSSLNVGELVAVDFLAKYGMRVERFTQSEMRQGKTPDFLVLKGSDLVLYCEAKHVQHDQWLDKQLEVAAPLEIVGGARPDPVFNRLTDRIHEAAKQFDAVNHDRDYPNVLVFTNSDRQCGFPDLIAVLTGNFHADGGAVEPIYKQYSEGRIREEKQTVDLYVWRDEFPGSRKKEKLFFNQGSKHYATLCAVFHSHPERHRRMS